MKLLSMRGREIDVAAIIAKHGDKAALGNASMNARGDIIGAGGAVIKPAAQVKMEYNRNNPKAVRQASLKDIAGQVLTPVEAVKAARQAHEPKVAPTPTRKLTED